MPPPAPAHDDIAGSIDPPGQLGEAIKDQSSSHKDDNLVTMRVREMIAASTPTVDEEGSLEEEGDEEFGVGTAISNIPTFSPNGKFTSFETRGENDPESQNLTFSSSGDEVTRPRKRDRKYVIMFWIMIIFDAIILAGFLGAYYGRKEHGETLISPQESGDFQSVPEDANSVPAPSPIVQTTPKPTRSPHRKHDHKEKLEEKAALEDASAVTTSPSSSPVALSTPKPTRSPHKRHNHIQNHHDHEDNEPEQSGVFSNSTSVADDEITGVASSNATEPKQNEVMPWATSTTPDIATDVISSNATDQFTTLDNVTDVTSSNTTEHTEENAVMPSEMPTTSDVNDGTSSSTPQPTKSSTPQPTKSPTESPTAHANKPASNVIIEALELLTDANEMFSP